MVRLPDTLVAELRAAILRTCIDGEESVVYLGWEVLGDMKALHLLQEMVAGGLPAGVLKDRDKRNLMQARTRETTV